MKGTHTVTNLDSTTCLLSPSNFNQVETTLYNCSQKSRAPLLPVPKESCLLGRSSMSVFLILSPATHCLAKYQLSQEMGSFIYPCLSYEMKAIV